MLIFDHIFDYITSCLKRKPMSIIAVTLVIVVPVSLGLFFFRTSFSVVELFQVDKERIEDFHFFEEQFGNSNRIVVSVETDNIFNVKTFELINKISSELTGEVPYIKSVSSITDLVEEPLDEGVIGEISDLPALDMLPLNRIVSSDRKQTLISAEINIYPEKKGWIAGKEPNQIIGRAVQKVIDQNHQPGYTLIGIGAPVAEANLTREMMADFMFLLIIGIIIALALIAILCRNIKAIIGTILTIGFTLTTLFGVMGWLSISGDSNFMLMPVMLVMATGIGYTIHLYVHYQRYNAGRSSREEKRSGDAAVFALQKASRPVIFTALTTIMAMLSFSLVGVKALRWTGVACAGGVALTTFFVLFFYPALLALQTRDRGEDKDSESTRKSITFTKIDLFLGKVDVFRIAPISIILFVLIIPLSLSQFQNINVNLDRNRMLGDGIPYIRELKAFTSSPLGYDGYYNLLITAGGDSRNPNFVQKLNTFENALQELPLVSNVYSLNTLAKEFNRSRYPERSEEELLPDSIANYNGMINFLERFYGIKSYGSLLSEDNRTVNILVGMNRFASKEMENHLDSIEKLRRQIFPEGTKTTAIGNNVIIGEMNRTITGGLLLSLSLSVVIIGIIMIFLFGSLKLGMVALIPNLVPLLITGGIIGILRENMDFVVMAIGPMLLGLGVDDTIHYLTHLNGVHKENGNMKESAAMAMQEVGKALIETTVILCLLFSVFLFSKAHNIRTMGLYTIVGLSSALLLNVFITPILASLVSKKTKQD